MAICAQHFHVARRYAKRCLRSLKYETPGCVASHCGVTPPLAHQLPAEAASPIDTEGGMIIRDTVRAREVAGGACLRRQLHAWE